MNMVFSKQLPSPEDIKKQMPTDEYAGSVFCARNNTVKDILSGKDDRFILIIGPCSADSKDPVMEYISRLYEVYSEVKDKLFIIPRVYTAKPRTTGSGYMGMLHQPEAYAPSDISRGIITIRELLLDIAREFDFTCADEMLYPENYEYFSDLVGYVAVGARSVEDQKHRLVASGLDIPAGMKNPTGGSIASMLNAVKAAQMPHTFGYRGWEVSTAGNRYAHAILRGCTDSSGNSVPNFGKDTLSEVYEMYMSRSFANPSLIVDVNHANSGKDYLKQPAIAMDVLASGKKDPDIKKLVKGLMIESYLEDGNQKIGENIFGKSITDPCLGWDKSRDLIFRIADNI
ncbi:MAG: 3-deoxy-7-phosphoheptulonate synthase [Anaerofustis stercorihominis]|nr:3-deoxy-7-phosphoheptulonate synthase [Anaerofustis stercorihominis]